jgi:uncharacterized protein
MLAEIFGKPKPVLGRISLLPLPGSSAWRPNMDLQRLISRVEQEAAAFTSGGVDGILVENTFDHPWPVGRMDAMGIPVLTMLADRIKTQTGLPIGISVLANDPETALAVAVTVGAAFVRVPLLTGAKLTEGGFIEGRIRQVQAMRNAWDRTQGVKLFVDVSLQHISVGGRNMSGVEHLVRLRQEVEASGLADAILVSDEDLGPEELQDFVQSCGLPVIVFSSRGADAEAYFKYSGGLVLGEYVRKDAGFSTDGSFPPTVDMARIEETVSRLGSIKDVRQLEPDYFLDRMNS